MRYIERRRYYKMGLLGFCVFLFFANLFLGSRYLKNNSSKFQKYENELKTLKSELKNIKLNKVKINNENIERNKYIQKIDSLFSYFEKNCFKNKKIDMSDLLEMIQSSARECGVFLNVMSSKKGNMLKDFPEIKFRIINISVAGDYIKIKKFFYDLEQLPYYIMKHEKLEFEGKDTTVKINLEMQVPFIKLY